MGIGAILIPRWYKKRLVDTIKDIKTKYNIIGEMKWRKVSPAYVEFYKEIIDFFIREEVINFYAIVVDKDKVDLAKYHDGNEELAFYKWYYFLLKKKFETWATYYIYLDFKVKQDKKRVQKLQSFFDIQSEIEHFEIKKVEERKSDNHELIQLADFLIWAVCYAYNNKNEKPSKAKEELIAYICEKVWKETLASKSPLSEKKLNIFEIDLRTWAK